MKVVIANNELDSEGDVLDFDTMEFRSEYVVTEEFNLLKPICILHNVRIEGKNIVGDINESFGVKLNKYGNKYPSIIFYRRNRDVGKLTNLTIYGVGLTERKNPNPNVKSIFEQNKNQS